MDFNGPEPADLAEVRSLNIAFLEYLRAAPDGQLLQQLPTSLRPAVIALTDRQVQRLAAVPFLVLTMRESDHSSWARIFRDRPWAREYVAGNRTGGIGRNGWKSAWRTGATATGNQQHTGKDERNKSQNRGSRFFFPMGQFLTGSCGHKNTFLAWQAINNLFAR